MFSIRTVCSAATRIYTLFKSWITSNCHPIYLFVSTFLLYALLCTNLSALLNYHMLMKKPDGIISHVINENVFTWDIVDLIVNKYSSNKQTNKQTNKCLHNTWHLCSRPRTQSHVSPSRCYPIFLCYLLFVSPTKLNCMCAV